MEKKELKQTTLRVDPLLLRKARFYLEGEHKSVSEFLVEQLETYVAHHEKRDHKPELAATA